LIRWYVMLAAAIKSPAENPKDILVDPTDLQLKSRIEHRERQLSPSVDAEESSNI
jgi:hypothetical protein